MSAPQEPAVVIPRGWDALAALGPIRDRLDARCACGQRAIVGTLTAWRCAAHPPQPGEWGAALNWAPTRLTGACPGATCYCGRCLHYLPQGAPPAVRDAAVRRRKQADAMNDVEAVRDVVHHAPGHRHLGAVR